MSKIRLFIFLLIGGVVLFSPVKAQEKEGSNSEELAKKLANPVASLISVPFQGNVDYGIGPYNGVKYTTNFQPVVPIPLGSELNLITRYIIPIVDQRDITGEGTKQFGLSDATVSAFLSPTQTRKGMVWGVGPAFLLPIGTDNALSARKWAVGPTIVALKQTKGGFTFGALGNQLWSFAGDNNRRNVNQMYLQPFITKNWKSGAGVSLNSEMTFDWVLKKTTAWLNPDISGITKLGKQTVQLVVGPRIPLSGQADFGFRGAIIFVFPE